MKSKMLLLSIFSVFLSGCNTLKLIRESKKQVITYYDNKCNFEIVKNYIILRTTFNEKTVKNFMLDLGSPINIIFRDSTIDTHLKSQIKLSASNAISADGHTTNRDYNKWGKISTCPFSIDSSFISGIYTYENYLCSEINGMWGAELFAPEFKGKRNKILLISMQDSTLCLLDTLPDLTEWTRLDTDFTLHSHIKVEVKINNQKAVLYFDTGFSGDIMLTDETYMHIYKAASPVQQHIIYGQIVNSISGIRTDTAYSTSAKISIAESTKIDSVSIFSTRSAVVNAMGMGIIKRFNVLVDYQKQNLYLQPNFSYRPLPDSFFTIKGFRVRLSQDGTIKVINLTADLNAEKSGIQIGDEILSINDISVDQEDKCSVLEKFEAMEWKSHTNVVTVKRNENVLKFEI